MIDRTQLERQVPLTEEEGKAITKCQDYLSKHRIPDLFNDVMSLIAYNRPNNPKEYIKDCLTHAKVNGDTITLKEQLFKKEDFDEMFNIYDVLDQKSIASSYLVNALESIGMLDGQKFLMSNHKETMDKGIIGKKQFTTIMDGAYKQLISEPVK